MKLREIAAAAARGPVISLAQLRLTGHAPFYIVNAVLLQEGIKTEAFRALKECEQAYPRAQQAARDQQYREHEAIYAERARIGGKGFDPRRAALFDALKKREEDTRRRADDAIADCKKKYRQGLVRIILDAWNAEQRYYFS